MNSRREIGLKHVLITGANGFVGRNLCGTLSESGFSVRAALRSESAGPTLAHIAPTLETVITGDLDNATDWRAALSGVDAVVHCAARVHILEETAEDPLEAFRTVNVAGSQNLARQAADAGVKHFVFLSSIGARVAQEDSIATPYQISKLEAENALREIAMASGMNLTLLRPPLIYGADAPGNFALLVKIIESGLPLPLASVRNRRAFLYVGNLCDAVRRCLEQNAGSQARYEIADGPGVSTPDLIRTLAAALGRSTRLWHCPLWLLRATAKLFGRSATLERLTSSLETDLAPLERDLNWTPPWDLKAGLAASFAQDANTRATSAKRRD